MKFRNLLIQSRRHQAGLVGLAAGGSPPQRVQLRSIRPFIRVSAAIRRIHKTVTVYDVLLNIMHLWTRILGEARHRFQGLKFYAPWLCRANSRKSTG